MIDPSMIKKFVAVVRQYLVGVVALTGKVITAFVAAVFAGMGAGIVLGISLALIAALGLAGIRVQPDEPGVTESPSILIDVTPLQA